jgi:hypothetical protein
MSQPAKPRAPHFTIFRSAADEAADVPARDASAREDAHLHATSGYIVQTHEASMPYKVVFNHVGKDDTEQPCATMREGEAIIRRNTPMPPKKDTLREHDESASSAYGLLRREPT